MGWTVKERLGLPVLNEKGDVEGTEALLPGDTITKAEFDAAGQTEDDIKSLVAEGAIEED